MCPVETDGSSFAKWKLKKVVQIVSGRRTKNVAEKETKDFFGPTCSLSQKVVGLNSNKKVEQM